MALRSLAATVGARLVDELEVGLMHQGGGLEGVAGLLLRHQRSGRGG